MANIKELIESIESTDSSFDEKLAAINKMEETLVAMRQQEETAVQDNVDLIVEAIKVMENKVTAQLEVAKSIVPEKGDKGDKGKDGKDGKSGLDGKDGKDGLNGKDGKDGKDGVSVTDAKIDFDGSLIISLSTGQEINVGEVVAPELQEKIKLVTSGGAGTVLPSQTGNANKYLKTDGSVLSWATVSGGGSGTVTSVAATVPTGLSVSGSPITSSGTLAITYDSGYSIPTTASQTNWDTGYTDRLKWDGGATGLVAATGRTSLSAAKSGANTDITSITLTTGTISTAPSANTDIVNKSYADSIASGINFHAACNLATITALSSNTYSNGTSGVGATLTTTANGALSVDSVSVTSGQRILVKNEASTLKNGVYTVTQVGDGSNPYILTRATDYDTSGAGTNEIDAGDFILVLAGSTLANTSWVQQTLLPITVGTTGITFIQFGAGGSGTVTSVSGTGTVSGLTLTGTVTSSGNLTLGGTLDLSSPPAIGGTTPAAGTHTTLNLTGTTDQVSSVAVSSNPSAPSAGNLKTFARTIAGGYTAPAFLNATQAVAMLQPAFANKKIGIWNPSNNTTTVNVLGLSLFSGTATSSTNTTTSLFTRAIKLNYSSSATAGTLGNLYQATSSYTLGVTGTPAYGGFYYVIRFGIADSVASPRTFVGLTSSVSAPTNVEPSTLTNSIGVGQGAANTNLFVYYGGSAAQTPIDLGVNFPTNTNSADWYELTLFAPPTSNNTVYYQVIRLNTGNVASGTLTGTAGTALPANTTKLAISNWRTNNATASAVTLSIGGIYVETDY